MAEPSDTHSATTPTPAPQTHIFPFLQLPRELRDQIYHTILLHTSPRAPHAPPIERRHLEHFTATPASILLLLLHSDALLVSRQFAREALEVLFKRHTVAFSCGPYVLRTVLEGIEGAEGEGRVWLGWLRRVELEWVAFPDLRWYPQGEEGPEEGEGDGYGYDGVEVDVEYVRGVTGSSRRGYEGRSYDDSFDYDQGYDDNYDDDDDYDDQGERIAIYPPYHHHHPHITTPTDPFGLTTHNPFQDPTRPRPNPPTTTPSLTLDPPPSQTSTNLARLISNEVTPLFAYLASPSCALTSLTLPLYFLSAQNLRARPALLLPLKLRYWVSVCVHALGMLVGGGGGSGGNTNKPTTTLQHVRVRYAPRDVWASMDPADNLGRMVERGIWFDEEGGEREGEGAAFRAVWRELEETWGIWEGHGRFGLEARVELVPWDGDVDSGRVGDELDVLFSRG